MYNHDVCVVDLLLSTLMFVGVHIKTERGYIHPDCSTVLYVVIVIIKKKLHALSVDKRKMDTN